MISPARWIEALKVIPRLDRGEWQRLDIIARWLVLTRSAVLVMTLFSGLLAGVAMAARGTGELLPFWLAVIGVVLAHATNNMLNDLVDYTTGVDHDNYFRSQYGPQPLVHGLLDRRGLLGYIAVTGLAALAIGLYLVWSRGGGVAWFLGAGAFFVLFYTWPLKKLGLGEPAVLLVWGPLITGGVYYTAAGALDLGVVAISLPYACGVTAVLMGKHIDKLDSDRVKGIRTLPVLLGERTARHVTLLLFAAQYLGLFGLMLLFGHSPVILLPLLALTTVSRLWPVYTHPKPAAPPDEYPHGIWPLWYVALAFWQTRRFGALYLLALAVDAALLRSRIW